MLSLLTSKLGITLGLLAICLVASCCMLRRCDRWINPPEPRIKTVGPYSVKEVLTGASIEVAVGKRRTRTVHLQFVQAPADGELAEAARQHLAEIAGNEIRVSYEKHGIFRGEAQDGQRRLESVGEVTAEAPATVEVGREMTDEEFESMKADLEGRGPIVGIVYGASGIDCNLSQINHGFADCTADAPKNYRVARDLAKKAKEGIWGAKR